MNTDIGGLCPTAQFVSKHCTHQHHAVCLEHYGGRRCECDCHYPAALARAERRRRTLAAFIERNPHPPWMDDPKPYFPKEETDEPAPERTLQLLRLQGDGRAACRAHRA